MCRPPDRSKNWRGDKGGIRYQQSKIAKRRLIVNSASSYGIQVSLNRIYGLSLYHNFTHKRHCIMSGFGTRDKESNDSLNISKYSEVYFPVHKLSDYILVGKGARARCNICEEILDASRFEAGHAGDPQTHLVPLVHSTSHSDDPSCE